MSTLNEQVLARAASLGVPFSVHVDLTYRCNERCVHCYLDHHGRNEMTTNEWRELLDQLAEAGTFFLTLSGGEIFLRPDFFEILEHARARTFCVTLKTNATLIGAREADDIRSAGVNAVHVSIYSHRPEVHDAITLVRGSWERSVAAIRLLRTRGQKVIAVYIATRPGAGDHPAVRALADELGAGFRIDPTIVPKLDGDTSVLALQVARSDLVQIMTRPEYVGNVEEFCALTEPGDSAALDDIPCSAGHTHGYIAPNGDVFPCVQFPMRCGSVRQQRFVEIWRNSAQMREVRSIRMHDLPVCSGCSHALSCSRCPGLALVGGDLRGPSFQDCEKAWARTGQKPTGYPRSLA